MADKKIKKAAALATMFTLGVSAFAGNGSLWDINANTYDVQAVDDIVKIFDYAEFSLDDGNISSEEREIFRILTKEYDKNYGNGSCSSVMNEMNRLMNTQDGYYLMHSENRDIGKSVIANESVRNNAIRQKSSNKISKFNVGLGR